MSYRDLIKKNSNDFSFTSVVIDEVNNLQFKEGSTSLINALSSHSEPSIVKKDEYIWYALSATAEDVGETIYLNVLNYMQNVADIDTCTTKALLSMVLILGTNYSVFDGISSIPLELLNLIDIFSMRKDCLLDSNLISRQSREYFKDINAFQVSAISTCIPTDISASSALSGICLSINADNLDNFISNTYATVISDNLYITYDLISNDFPIYRYLSNEILSGNFVLPNKYKDKIDAYKIKWKIPVAFDPEEEMEKIENGLSTYQDYDTRLQDLLSIEIKRESAPKDETLSRTKYAYFKEKKVKEYFNFIELWYNSKNYHYENAQCYDVDNNYVELSSIDTTIKLLNEDGITLKPLLIEYVVLQLLQLTNTIRDLREYLKSHALRTYMKGTFLLMSYLVNEYLKNLSDTKGLDWKQDDNLLDLVEYVDLTLYYNIKANDVEEDQLIIGENATDRTKELNSLFWKDGSTNAGNATFVDTTNIVRIEDKSKVVLCKTFSLEQITDFYQNVLRSLQDKNTTEDAETSVYDFLSTIFETGADNTWWSNEYSKVMTTLTNGKRTKDIEKYLADLKTYHNASLYILSSYSPTYGTTLLHQLENAKDNFIGKIKQKYNLDILDSLKIFDELYALLQLLDAELNTLKASFDDLVLRFNTVVNGYMNYTSSYAKGVNTHYALAAMADYYMYVDNNIYNNLVRTTLKAYVTNYLSEHNSLLNLLKATILKYNKLISSIELSFVHFNPDFVDYDNIINNNIDDLIQLEIALNIKPNDGTNTLAAYISDSEKYFENAYLKLKDFINSLTIYLNNQYAAIFSEIQLKLNEHFLFIQLKALDQLSMLLGLPNYEYLQNNKWLITTCISDILNDLNYDSDPWYKYKTLLFLKYTGQEIGDTPYYYPLNTIHPSYQIHPCLSNFIEKVDYVYPILNLAGIAESALKQETLKFLDGELASLIDKGYLKEIWRNPLNSNQDYLTRYEKVDHHDALLTNNEFFGWDGFIHPTAQLCCFNNGWLKSSDTIIVGNTCVSNILYDGQNYSSYDIAQFECELSTSKALLCAALSTNANNIDIKQYGLDIYGNSYMLVSLKTLESNDLVNVLWFRRKNMSIPTLAFVCGANKEYSSVENTPYFNCAFLMHDYANTAVLLSTDALIKTSTINGADILSTPTFDDFVFSPSRTSLYLRKENRIYHADIVLQLFDDDYVGYKRFALQDLGNRSEYLKPDNSNMTFRAWYFNGQEVGGIYSKETTKTNDLCVEIEVVKRINNYTYGRMPHMTLSVELPNANINTLKYACDADGNIAIAYVRSKNGSNNILSSTTKVNTSTNINQSNNALSDLSTKIDVFTNSIIAVLNIHTIGNSLRNGKFAEYAPNADIGFMLAKEGTNNITFNLYGNELEENGFLKVQLATPAIASAKGIDFRRVCPIRVSENDHTNTTDGDIQCVSTDSSTYHIKNNSFTALSGVVNTNINVHFLESVYNQYVKQESDEQWYELTDEERLGRKHPDSSKNAGNFDYLQLAHYDVMKHLSVLKDEQSNDVLDKLADSLSARSLLGIIQPYMMQDGYIPNTYLSGFYCTNDASTNPNKSLFSNSTKAVLSNCILRIRDINNEENVYSTISVGWMLLNSKVKLDFNAALYLPENIASKLGVNVSNSSGAKYRPDFNERNKRNLFLNLDRPGEAGILNVYEKNGSNPILRSVWYIKNISEGNIPKFILRSIVDNSPTKSLIMVFNLFNLKATKDTNDENLTLIATEDPILSYISFE